MPAALDDVISAQALAEGGGWLDIQARCHFTRGNLFFPLGRVDECLVQHRAALDLAERTGSAEAKAPALLAASETQNTHGATTSRLPITSGGASKKASELGWDGSRSRTRPMHAHTMLFELKLQDSLVAGHEAVSLAVAVGQKRAEMIAHSRLCLYAFGLRTRGRSAAVYCARSRHCARAGGMAVRTRESGLSF